MDKPRMILFDYGQTLVNETHVDALRGTRAVLEMASKNPDNVSAEEVQALADELLVEIGVQGVDFEKRLVIETHTHVFQRYLYEYFGIEFEKTQQEIERIFENNAFEAKPTKDIHKLLKFLEEKNIRTGVISNISFSGGMLLERINKYIPSNKFEFVIASSEYLFRKPHKRIFELAIRKAHLDFSDVWYCGDNAVFDVDGAAECGIFSVWYKGALEKTNKSIPRKEALQINDWGELIDYLVCSKK